MALTFPLISGLASWRDFGHIPRLQYLSQRQAQPIVIETRKIRIAIVGVGNCASSLVQGINFYDGSSANGNRIGLMHRQVGGYRPSDIEVVAAFDIDRRKVGLDVSKAIFSPPNCTKVFCEKIKLTGAIVKMGCVLDGYAPHMQDQDPLRTFLPLEKETTREEIIAE
jgi:myo-inositol-1-phosphate synthase